MAGAGREAFHREAVMVSRGGVDLNADLLRPGRDWAGVVLFAHGSGSSRLSPRNRTVAEYLARRGLASVLLDLLTAEEDRVDQVTREYRFDIPRLADRLIQAADWLDEQAELSGHRIGCFGASTGAAAAIIAAAERPERIAAVVSRGGRADMAEDALGRVRAPTLLIVGARDVDVLALNRQAAQRMRCSVTVEVVPGAGHLFEEPGALERVAAMAGDWFRTHLVEDTTNGRY